MFCWPCFLTGKCDFKVYSKIKALKYCDVGYFDYKDIGIASDEIKRHSQLSEVKRSILVEMNITEEEAKQICIKNGLLSPLYTSFKRDGCALCPHAKAEVRQQWFFENPNAKEKILQMQKVAAIERPGQFPLRNKRNFL